MDTSKQLPKDTPKQDTPQKEAHKADLKETSQHLLTTFVKEQTFIIAIIVGVLLLFTAYRMLQLADPPADQVKIDENSVKLKRIVIDPKVVDEIKQLNANSTSVTPSVNQGRSNPFNE